MIIMESRIAGGEDTLQRLAALYYGRWELFFLIYEANRAVIGNIDGLRPGMPLQIPAPQQQELRHVVGEGDSWEALSLTYYDTEHFARLLRKANGGIVIYESIGTELIIPALVTPGELEAASRRRAA
ncbi:MAG: phage tail protein [Spirochaetales bacterium]|nr:phage tail protein [Spirochaetales bacterium]